MNREIKFRAWDGENMRDTFSVQSNGDGVNYRGGIMNSWVLIQFTGLKDKNGKDIYEGDIVRGQNNNPFTSTTIKNYVIFWGRDSWRVKNTYFSLQELFDYCDDNIEVIGNIYENPQLI